MILALVAMFHVADDSFFFFNDTATTEIYTLSLHDALPIYGPAPRAFVLERAQHVEAAVTCCARRSEEHTSELQSRSDLVCRLLLEKKNKKLRHPGSSVALNRSSERFRDYIRHL